MRHMHAAPSLFKGICMNRRYLLLVSTLFAVSIFPNLGLADGSKEVMELSARCDRGDAKGCFNLGVIYENRAGFTQDADAVRAAAMFRKACHGRYAAGCFFLGLMHEDGRGVKQDFAEAVALFRKACAGGDALGCFNLGVLYEAGTNVRQSNSDALNYYGKACDLKSEGGCESYARVKNKR